MEMVELHWFQGSYKRERRNVGLDISAKGKKARNKKTQQNEDGKIKEP